MTSRSAEPDAAPDMDSVPGLSDWRRDAVLAGLAIVAWAALATLWRPALRLELAPVWMVLCMSTLPRIAAKARRRR